MAPAFESPHFRVREGHVPSLDMNGRLTGSRPCPHVDVAQRLEPLSDEQEVGGSNPLVDTTIKGLSADAVAMLAWQAACIGCELLCAHG